jgi:phage N-6-adenine-methyltransferase
VATNKDILMPAGGKTRTDVHGTPLDLFNDLSKEFGGFELDPCSDGTNSVCTEFYTPETDGLRQDWGARRVFMNPPYSDMFRWMEKAYDASLRGALVVCLVPVRTDTKWWHDIAMRGEIRFIRGRLRFVGNATHAPFPSAVIVFRPHNLLEISNEADR